MSGSAGLGSQRANAAAKALDGGIVSYGNGGQPTEDSAEVAAIFAVVDVATDGAGTRVFDVNATTHVVTVGAINIPGQQDFTSKWTPGQSTWDGLQRR